ncbi:MAG: GNAT family N-acetyltransferase, partial [Chloroflexi bacterium]|nr:GNAT family N-acetyltransferase [Chloroflexota bacterium]
MIDARTTLKRYPVTVTLEDGAELTIRPLEKRDKIPLARFFQAIPEEDRFYLKENVAAPEVIHGWIDNMDYERAIPIVALYGDKIVADATLHRSRAPARRHIAELRIVVDPEFRGRGLGTRLVDELIELARALGLDKVFFELVDRREMGAIRSAVRVGFEEVAVLKG